jgi:hypothetical protein
MFALRFSWSANTVGAGMAPCLCWYVLVRVGTCWYMLVQGNTGSKTADMELSVAV